MSASIFAKGMVWLFKKGHFEKFLDRFERSHQEVLSINEDQLKAQVKKGNYQTNILTHSFGERQMRKRDAGLFIPFIWLVALFWAILMLPVGIPLTLATPVGNWAMLIVLGLSVVMVIVILKS